jgi:hypothetical protein
MKELNDSERDVNCSRWKTNALPQRSMKKTTRNTKIPMVTTKTITLTLEGHGVVKCTLTEILERLRRALPDLSRDKAVTEGEYCDNPSEKY